MKDSYCEGFCAEFTASLQITAVEITDSVKMRFNLTTCHARLGAFAKAPAGNLLWLPTVARGGGSASERRMEEAGVVQVGEREGRSCLPDDGAA